MEVLAGEHDGATVLYLSRRDVVRCRAAFNPVDVAAETLRAHARGATVLPEEAYLGWQTPDGHAARSLAMLGGVVHGSPVYGVKIINASLGNVARGLPRAQGISMIFDSETARPLVMMEAAYVSALRTAAVSMVAVNHLAARGLTTAAFLGCGTLAKAHLALLPAAVQRIQLFDLDRTRAELLASAMRTEPAMAGRQIIVADDARSCVRGAGLVVPVTTVTEGYLPYAWLEPGSVVVHVSLDDVMPDVVRDAELVLVDDWGLVSHDHRRLLGRMYRAGTLLGPNGKRHPEAAAAPQARRVDGSIGEVLLGVRPGRRTDDGVILVNPFGMSILDVAIGAAVYRSALELGLGMALPV